MAASRRSFSIPMSILPPSHELGVGHAGSGKFTTLAATRTGFFGRSLRARLRGRAIGRTHSPEHHTAVRPLGTNATQTVLFSRHFLPAAPESRRSARHGHFGVPCGLV